MFPAPEPKTKALEFARMTPTITTTNLKHNPP